ncbi:hypothetical protein INR49_028058 [Caranx melampygus]|nr:hypothetical protein INR49_028058 [Caranx melampygus]
MQTGSPSSSQFLTIGDEGLKAFNMSILGDSSDYQWKEFQGAKLASLFGLDQDASQGNESFQYTAPKQPSKSSNPAPPSQKQTLPPGAPAVLFATAVQAFRYINGQYVKQGKLGAAALGNHATKEYKLLLYLSQQKQVTTAKIHTGFVFTVCLAKANSAASLDAVVVQDLSLGEGQGVENGDSLEGMKKAGRRLIIIPPSLAYGSKGVPNCVPANSTLIFEVELRRVKFSKDSGSDRASASSRDSAAPSPAPSSAPSVENLTPEPAAQTPVPGPGKPGEPPLRAKSNSLSEQLANPDATKAKLISRMAKMGQPMLPFLAGVASQPESSDSELEDTSNSRMKDRAVASSPVQISSAAPAAAHVHPHPHTAPPSALLPVMTTVAPQPGLMDNSRAFQSSVAPSQLQPVGQVYPTQTVPYVGSGDLTSFLMTEARQQNTEVRLAVGKVADKVDQLTSKIDDLQRQGSLSMGVYMEQSNLLMEQRNDSLKSSSEHNQARLLQAERDKVRLTEDLASSTARLSQLQLEATAQQQKAVELQSKLSSALQDSESHCQRIAALETQQEELKETAERAQAQYRSEKQRRKEMEQRMSNLEEEAQDLKTDKEGLERTLQDRKRKWQAERQRRDEEVEELRKSNQQEVDTLRAQLRKARTSTDSAVSGQLSQLQAELDEDWKRKCEQMLATAKEQHRRELTDLSEQRDALQDKVTQLEEKFTALKQSRDLEEQRSLQHHGQTEELQALQEKYTALERQGGAVREKLERRVNELEKKLAEKESSGDTAAEVKRVMNGVFHSLRGEFDLSESYSGQAVLAVIVSTIKNVTLQLLSGSDSPSLRKKEEEEAEEQEEEESDDVKQREKEPHENVHVNGERQVTEGDEDEEEHVAEPSPHQVSETQIKQEVAAETETLTESETQKQTETSQGTDVHTASSAEQKSQETTGAAESEAQQELRETPAEPGDMSAHPHDRLDEGSPPEDGEGRVSDIDNVEPEGEMNAASQKAFGPPANPPPPPTALEDASGEDTGLTGGIGEKNGKEPFFQITTPANPPTATSEEDDEDEMSLKGRPPPAPLFGDDDDDNDLDWLN